MGAAVGDGVVSQGAAQSNVEFAGESAATGVIDARALQQKLAAMREHAPEAPSSPLFDEPGPVPEDHKPKPVKKAPKLKTRESRPTGVMAPQELRRQLEGTRAPASEIQLENHNTGVMEAAALQASLAQARPTSLSHFDGSSLDGSNLDAPHPQSSWARRSSRLQVTMITALVILPWLLMAGFLLMERKAQRVYLQSEQPLRSGPSAGVAYQDVALLRPGSELRVHADMGVYLLVQTTTGHVGFIPSEEVSAAPPVATPPFADCRPSPLALNPDVCLARAKEQTTSCRTGCAGAAACESACAAASKSCEAGCRGTTPDAAATARPADAAAKSRSPETAAKSRSPVTAGELAEATAGAGDQSAPAHAAVSEEDSEARARKVVRKRRKGKRRGVGDELEGAGPD